MNQLIDIKRFFKIVGPPVKNKMMKKSGVRCSPPPDSPPRPGVHGAFA
ncbi:MAG: hypothetical protein GY859_35990 [Desulfobacterales bacterium]|nr:hypothetical protein [Desulfobacterales bacterium]